MDVEREFKAMTEQLDLEKYWIIKVDRESASLYFMYVMGILVGLFLSRKVFNVR